MEKIIKKAIELNMFGDGKRLLEKKINWFIKDDLIYFDNGIAGVTVSMHKLFLRPEFWTALGEDIGEKGWEIRRSFFGLVFNEDDDGSNWDTAVSWLEGMI